MGKLRYKDSSVVPNQIHIDMMRCGQELCQPLQKAFGMLIPSPLPGGILKVTFYIYKKKPSWILCAGKKIEFVYDIWPVRNNVLRPNLITGYKLDFKLYDKRWYQIDVSQSCYPKKRLIKYLLNALIR